jgi:glycosyltransferase involved in cell wall biosynthesis
VRILLDYRPALRERTGVGEYVHELARALVASAPPGETLTLFSSSRRDRLDPSVVPGARVVDRRIPVSLLNLAWHRFGWPPVERLAGSFDVVHSMHPLLMPSSQAAQVITVHDLDFMDHPERTAREVRRDYPALAPTHARRADAVVVVSQHTANDVARRLGVSPERIAICHPGAPPWSAREDEPTTGCVLFLGTLEPRKNLGVLLDAYESVLARHPHAPPLVLAGRVPEEGAALAARVQQGPLAGHVELTGYVTDAQRLELYRRALVFVLPSHTEGFGLTALEAMTCGVPVIAADRGALPETVGRAGLLFDADSARDLAAVLETVLTSPAKRTTMREDGLRQARRFQWTDTASAVRQAWIAALTRRRIARG